MARWRDCAELDCTEPVYAKALCRRHYDQRLRRRHSDGSVNQAEIVTDDAFMVCPDSLLALAGACADIDAKAIVRLLWPHLLEASMAGVEPFTLTEAS